MVRKDKDGYHYLGGMITVIAFIEAARDAVTVSNAAAVVQRNYLVKGLLFLSLAIISVPLFCCFPLAHRPPPTAYAAVKQKNR